MKYVTNLNNSHLLEAVGARERDTASTGLQFNPLSAGDAFKRIHTVLPQLKFDRN